MTEVRAGTTVDVWHVHTVVTAPAGGRGSAVHVAAGSRVHAGDLVATVDR